MLHLEYEKINLDAQHCSYSILITSVTDPDPYVLGRLDLHPLVRGTDPDPDPSIIKQK